MSNSTSGAFAARSIASSRSLSNNPIKVYKGEVTLTGAAASFYTGINLPVGSSIISLTVEAPSAIAAVCTLSTSAPTTLAGTTIVGASSVPPVHTTAVTPILAAEPFIVLSAAANGADATGNTAKVTLVVANP